MFDAVKREMNESHLPYIPGEYSCLTVDMTFKRQIAYYLFTIYFPTVIIVFSSWMSFWLDHKSVSEDRMRHFHTGYSIWWC